MNKICLALLTSLVLATGSALADPAELNEGSASNTVVSPQPANLLTCTAVINETRFAFEASIQRPVPEEGTLRFLAIGHRIEPGLPGELPMKVGFSIEGLCTSHSRNSSDIERSCSLSGGSFYGEVRYYGNGFLDTVIHEAFSGGGPSNPFENVSCAVPDFIHLFLTTGQFI